MRLKPSRLALLAVVLVVAGGITRWLLSDSEMPSPASAPTRDDSNPAARESDRPRGGSDHATLATIPPITLPPQDMPLNRLWFTLQGPAQAGDTGAACRLAIETLRCSGAIQFAEAVAPSPQDDRGPLQVLLDFERAPHSFSRSAEDSDPRDQAVFDGLERRVRVAAKRCDGATPERAAIARGLLRAAALGGQPDAQTVYAAGEAWFLTEAGAMGSAEFDQWRREAPMIVARMLDAGHPEAPGLLTGAYSGQTWLSGLYDRDLERAAAFLILNARLMGKPELAERELTNLDAATRTRAREQAEALFEKHYAGRETPKATYYLGAGVRIARPDYGGWGNHPTPCERAPAPP